MLLKNESSNVVNMVLHGIGRINVKPNETIEVDDAYCLPRRGENPDFPMPPIMEMIAPQLKPVDDREIKAKLVELAEIKRKVKNSSVPEYDDLIKAGMAPARARQKVAAALATKQLQEDDEGDKE